MLLSRKATRKCASPKQESGRWGTREIRDPGQKGNEESLEYPSKGASQVCLMVCRHPSDLDRADRSQTCSESEISASTCLERRFGQMQNILS